jgi:hypothetical protein
MPDDSELSEVEDPIPDTDLFASATTDRTAASGASAATDPTAASGTSLTSGASTFAGASAVSGTPAAAVPPKKKPGRPKGAKNKTGSVVPRTTRKRATKKSIVLHENQQILDEIARADEKKCERAEIRKRKKAWHR